jgi:riboflavin synthase
MFTGLVEEVGELLRLRRDPEGVCLTLTAPKVSQGVLTGDSILVNGACLTVSSHSAGRINFHLLDETLLRTNLGDLHPGSKVNLECALPANGRLGGHFVQGHVDCTVNLLHRQESKGDLKLEFALPAKFSHYLVWKGSICVNGVSLTIADLTEARFGVWIIPLTRQGTNLGHLVEGDKVNIEVDLLAKYVERILLAKR